MSSWLAAISILSEVAWTTCPSICRGTPLIAFQTWSESDCAPADKTSSHSAKLISFGDLVFTRSAACWAGVGGIYWLMVKPAGGVGDAFAAAITSLQP